MSASLLVQGRGIWAHHHQLDKKGACRIGRHPDNQIRINDQNVSGKHAEIVHDGTRWVVRDLGTTNGTFLNDGRINEATLRNGDIVTLGGAELVFKDKETEVGEDVWGKTSLHYMKMNFDSEKPDVGPIQLPGLYDSNYSASQAAPDHVGRVPDSRGDYQTPEPAQSSSGYESLPPTVYQSGPPQNAAEMGKAWADSQLASILRDLSLQRGLSESAIMGKAILKLRDVSLAGSALLVDVEESSGRWTVLAAATVEGLVPSDRISDFALSAVREASQLGEMIDEVKWPVASQPFLAIPVVSGGKARGFVYLDRKPGNPGFNIGQGILARELGDYLLELKRQAARSDLADNTAGVPESKPVNFEEMYRDSAPMEKGVALLSGDKNRKPSKEELLADEKTAEQLRLQRMEFALLVPVDRSPSMKDLAHVVSVLDDLPSAEAQAAVVGRKGLLADRLSFDRIKSVKASIASAAESLCIAVVDPSLRPSPVRIPREVRFDEFFLESDGEKFPWGGIRLVSCGRIDRKPVIDLYCPSEQIHVRLSSSEIDFPALADLPDVHPNEACLVLLRRILGLAPEAIQTHTAKHFLSGRQPKPQKFGGLREYNNYNTWLLLSYFAEKIDLGQV